MPNYTIAADPNFNMATSYTGRNLAIDVTGVLWAVYSRRVGGIVRIYAAFSNDNGATWAEEAISVDANSHGDPTIAIDSTGIVHVTYTAWGRAPWPAAYGVFYKQRSVAGVWGAEETVSLQNTGFNSPTSSIAIDSTDNIHCVISTQGYGVNVGVWNIIYRARVAGVWGGVVQITDLPVHQSISAIAIDSSDIVHLAWVGVGWGLNPANSLVVYCRSPLWVPEVVDDGVYIDMLGSIAVDSGDVPYIAWIDWTGINRAYFSVRTAGVWTARERVDDANGMTNNNISIAIDRNDNLHFVYTGLPIVPPGLVLNVLYRRRISGVWQAQVNITTDDTDTQEYPVILWATWPQIGGVRTNVPLYRQYFIWKSMSVAVMFGYLSSIILPSVATNPATLVKSSSASLNGTLSDDGGEACSCGFEWGETSSLGNTTSTQSGTTGTSFLFSLTGLVPGRTYYFRAFATNSEGTSYGSILSFTAMSIASVMTLPATNITEHSARLNGIIIDDAGEAGDIRFQWGLTTEYGNVTQWRGHFPTGYQFSEDLSNLAEGTAFHFRAQFRNRLGIFSGNDMVFSTLVPLGPVTLIEDELIYALEKM